MAPLEIDNFTTVFVNQIELKIYKFFFFFFSFSSFSLVSLLFRIYNIA